MDIAILFMYLCAFALLPFMGFVMWQLVSGDRMRAEQIAALEAEAQQSAQLTAAPDAPVRTASPKQTRETTVVVRSA